MNCQRPRIVVVEKDVMSKIKPLLWSPRFVHYQNEPKGVQRYWLFENDGVYHPPLRHDSRQTSNAGHLFLALLNEWLIGLESRQY